MTCLSVILRIVVRTFPALGVLLHYSVNSFSTFLSSFSIETSLLLVGLKDSLCNCSSVSTLSPRVAGDGISSIGGSNVVVSCTRVLNYKNWEEAGVGHAI